MTVVFLVDKKVDNIRYIYILLKNTLFTVIVLITSNLNRHYNRKLPSFTIIYRNLLQHQVYLTHLVDLIKKNLPNMGGFF